VNVSKTLVYETHKNTEKLSHKSYVVETA